ncbi:MAG: DUF2726 domain-containing protein [Pseudomonadota bacterium]
MVNLSSLSQTHIIILFTALILFLAFCFAYIFAKKLLPYYSRNFLLSKAELRFFKMLQASVGDEYLIFSKIRIADVINCSDQNWKKGYGWKITSKHIDFLLCEPESTKIIAAIELDDKSHNLPHRRKRDIFVNKAFESANIPLVRFEVSRGYDIAFLHKKLKLAISGHNA